MTDWQMSVHSTWLNSRGSLIRIRTSRSITGSYALDQLTCGLRVAGAYSADEVGKVGVGHGLVPSRTETSQHPLYSGAVVGSPAVFHGVGGTRSWRPADLIVEQHQSRSLDLRATVLPQKERTGKEVVRRRQHGGDGFRWSGRTFPQRQANSGGEWMP